MKYCPNCNTLLDDDVQCCTNCGATVPDPEPVPEPTTVQPQSQPVTAQLPPYNTTGCAKASLILGIISIVFTCTCCLGTFGSIPGVIGIVLAVLDRLATPSHLRPSRIANAGLICSIIGTALGIIFLLLALLGALEE